MIQNELLDLIFDLEKIVPVNKCICIDTHQEDLKHFTDSTVSHIFLDSEDIHKIENIKAEEILLPGRSGETVICTFLDNMITKKLTPNFVIIVKKWSTLNGIIKKYYHFLKKYSIFYPETNKSICLLINNNYIDKNFKADIIPRYQLKYYTLPLVITKIEHKNIKKKIRGRILQNKFLRDLYSIWRENQGFIRFTKAIFKVLAERINHSPEISLNLSNDCGLDICLYDTDSANIIVSGSAMKCYTVSVVVCVYNALNDVKELLTSLWNNRSFPYEIIIIDDGSDTPTKEYLEHYSQITGCQLVQHSQSWGYTKSANDGIKRSNADYVVLLNSDTIVTNKWIEKMMEVFLKYPDTGIVGPLSNSATYQNIPHLHDFDTGNWAKNSLPDGFNVELVNYMLETSSHKKYPIVPTLNGFCTMISRKLINAIGFLDEEHFPIGYGEEVDYCLRARRAGFYLRVADDTYIFHEKSKSFGSINKKALSKQAAPYLAETYGDTYLSIGKEFEKNEILMDIRNHYTSNIQKIAKDIGKIMNKKIGFVLLTRGGNGGANSVCQEVIGMRKLGANAYIINTSNYMTTFSDNYPELRQYTYYYKKGCTEDLYQKTKDFDILIATIFTSVAIIRDVMKMNPNIKAAYYIQDYEPLFFDKEDIMYKEAYDSYTLIPNNCLFAKTNWLVKTVSAKHHVPVNKVTPSIDLRVYNPYLVKEKDIRQKLNITAMVRPRTPRRNPQGTLNVLKSLKEQFGNRINITIFGCTSEDLELFNEYCQFEYQNLGILKKGEVATLLAKSDLFIDMSYYQAFGRTGLEGMCYGCIPVLPTEGGTDEYAIHNVNAILVDTQNDKEAIISIAKIIEEPEKIQAMQAEAITTARKYGVLPASWSELTVLNKLYV